MYKLYKMKSGTIIPVSTLTQVEYLATSNYRNSGVTWKNYLKEKGIEDPAKINMSEVDQVLVKHERSLEDCLMLVEHELAINLARALMNRAKGGGEDHYDLAVEKFNHMSILLEKMKLSFSALKSSVMLRL